MYDFYMPIFNQTIFFFTHFHYNITNEILRMYVLFVQFLFHQKIKDRFLFNFSFSEIRPSICPFYRMQNQIMNVLVRFLNPERIWSVTFEKFGYDSLQ